MEGARGSVGYAQPRRLQVFVHLPNLEAELSVRLYCVRNLAFGSLAYSGYNVGNFTKCGFSWAYQRRLNRTSFFKYGCMRSGAHPPFPFVNGPLQVLSASLVRYIGTAPSVRGFVNRSQRTWVDTKRWGYDRHEDVALGYLLSHAQPGQLHRRNVTWVDAGGSRIRNLGCFKNSGGYGPPRPRSVALHFVKAPTGQLYLWGVLHDGIPHNSFNCTVWAGIE